MPRTITVLDSHEIIDALDSPIPVTFERRKVDGEGLKIVATAGVVASQHQIEEAVARKFNVPPGSVTLQYHIPRNGSTAGVSATITKLVADAELEE